MDVYMHAILGTLNTCIYFAFENSHAFPLALLSHIVTVLMAGHSQNSARQGYQFEPRYRPGEPRKQRRLCNSGQHQPPSPNPDYSSLSSMTWCLCGKCTMMTTSLECLCCVSSPRAIEKWAEVTSNSGNNACITVHPQFESACLYTHNLKTIFRLLCRRRGCYQLPQWTNKLYRVVAYRAYVLWVHNNRRLGFGNRMVLPACVVSRIREQFPCADDDSYTGFRAFEGLWIYSEH
ncbi:uncharacterized protein LOC122813382 [Protopterus annectens]|uniref:uncharacterized protein LOC122813382 n=1 Tax=Protopterus annectens TaxID=7888 RepID=UPI001CFA306D|nr:uncharacterized protein LOC122813382 [Protopterus annectens]